MWRVDTIWFDVAVVRTVLTGWVPDDSAWSPR